MTIDIPEITNVPVSSIGSFRMQFIAGNLDLSDYVLGGQITRTLENPVGTWTVHLRPIVKEKIMNAIPIAMNDYAELRLERTNQNADTAKLGSDIRVAMRGFVDSEEFQEHASNSMDGSLVRSYVLSGSDLGKLMARRLVFVPESIDLKPDAMINVAQQWLDSMNWTAESKEGSSTKGVFRPLSTWIKFFASSVYKGELEQMINQSKGLKLNSSGDWAASSEDSSPSFTFNINTDLPKLGTDDGAPEKIWVSTVPLLQTLSGNKSTSFWNLITFYCIKPFIEIFFTETNNDTTLNVRWSPLRKREGVGSDFEHYFPRQWSSGYAQPWFSEVLTRRTISTMQILSKTVRRQEVDRCTYFHTKPSSVTGDLTAGQSKTDGVANIAGSNPFIDGLGMKQFGIRSLVIDLPWWPMEIKEVRNPTDTESGEGSGYSSGVVQESFLQSCRDFTTWLVDTLTFTDTLYSGYITILGNTDIQLGEELYVVETGELYYIESIDHSWEVHPDVRFLTRIGVTRGTWPGRLTAPESDFGIVGRQQERTDSEGNTTYVVDRNVLNFNR